MGKNIDRNIKTPENIRMSLGIESREEFAKILGMSLRSYCYRLAGEKGWKYAEASKLAELGRCSMDELVLNSSEVFA